MSDDSYCNQCSKTFSSKYCLNKHILVCRGVNLYTCKGCKKSFSSRQSRWAHEKKCQLIRDDTPIIINNFGSENTNYITDDIKKKAIGFGIHLGIISIINAIYFKEQHPENHTVRLGHKDSHKFLKIYRDYKWVTKAKKDVCDVIINKCKNILLHHLFTDSSYDTKTINDVHIQLSMINQSQYFNICNSIIAEIINITEYYRQSE